MQITVIGTGYVGLVAGACFAEIGHHVTCVDNDQRKIDKLFRNEIPIYEPGLDEVVARNRAAGRLHFTTSLSDGVAGAELAVIAVGTPQSDDGAADLKYVMQVSEQLASVLRQETVVVLKSTVPVGTNDQVQALLDRKSAHKHRVVNNPEFLKEGDALRDFQQPDRVIIGVRDEQGRAVMTALYAPMKLRAEQLLFMEPRSAEMAKYVANAMLATRISFMNEIANLCEKVGADVHNVRVGVGADPRIGSQFLLPGPGFGGSCFPKDIKAIEHLAKEHHSPLAVVTAVDHANQQQKRVVFQKLHRLLGDVAGKKIAVWGLAFKARTDDVRESPALVLIEQLVAARAKVFAHDPEAKHTAIETLGSIAAEVKFVDDPYEALDKADALALVTEWSQYRELDVQRARESMNHGALGAVIVDGRNLWTTLALGSSGFRYEGIGTLARKHP
jgi:UDPglucose 6-dehydrogenase